MDEILAYVKSLAQNNIKEQITPQTKILSSQTVDSLGVIQLVTFLESTFKIKMDQSELKLDNLDSVEQMTSYLLGKMK